MNVYTNKITATLPRICRDSNHQPVLSGCVPCRSIRQNLIPVNASPSAAALPTPNRRLSINRVSGFFLFRIFTSKMKYVPAQKFRKNSIKSRIIGPPMARNPVGMRPEQCPSHVLMCILCVSFAGSDFARSAATKSTPAMARP